MRHLASLSGNISGVTFATRERLTPANSRRMCGLPAVYLACLAALAHLLILRQFAQSGPVELLAASSVPPLNLVVLGSGAFVWLVAICLWAAFRKA